MLIQEKLKCVAKIESNEDELKNLITDRLLIAIKTLKMDRIKLEMLLFQSCEEETLFDIYDSLRSIYERDVQPFPYTKHYIFGLCNYTYLSPNYFIRNDNEITIFNRLPDGKEVGIVLPEFKEIGKIDSFDTLLELTGINLSGFYLHLLHFVGFYYKEYLVTGNSLFVKRDEEGNTILLLKKITQHVLDDFNWLEITDEQIERIENKAELCFKDTDLVDLAILLINTIVRRDYPRAKYEDLFKSVLLKFLSVFEVPLFEREKEVEKLEAIGFNLFDRENVGYHFH